MLEGYGPAVGGSMAQLEPAPAEDRPINRRDKTEPQTRWVGLTLRLASLGCYPTRYPKQQGTYKRHPLCMS
jgi:hypothetical protein